MVCIVPEGEGGMLHLPQWLVPILALYNSMQIIIGYFIVGFGNYKD